LIKVQAVIFDFDGVLVESVDVKTKAFAALYKEYGQKIVNQVVEYHLLNGGISRFEKFRYYQNVLLGQSLSSDEERDLGIRFSEMVVDAVVAAPWVEGALQFLKNYYKRIPLFIASGTPIQEIKEVVMRRNMSKYFVSVHGSPAEKSEIILEICEKNRFDPNWVTMVGDALADYEGAKKSGARFVGRISGKDNIFPVHITIVENLHNLAAYL